MKLHLNDLLTKMQLQWLIIQNKQTNMNKGIHVNMSSTLDFQPTDTTDIKKHPLNISTSSDQKPLDY